MWHAHATSLQLHSKVQEDSGDLAIESLLQPLTAGVDT